jgi:ABC-type multidrug transport system ATPase subunit
MLEVNNLKVSFNEKEILNGITFEVRINQMIGISGDTGSGKSLIFKSILDYIPFSNGTTIFENKKVAYNHQNQIDNLRKRVGFVSQDSKFLEFATLLENIQWIGGVSKDRAIELASFVEIADQLYLKVSEVTGAEKIRLKLALALLNTPEILFVDEPLSSLQFDEIDPFIDLLRRAKDIHRIGVVLATQKRDILGEVFNKRYRLEDGVLNEF